MVRKAAVVIEMDGHGFYAWCPEMKGASLRTGGSDDLSL